MHETYYGLQYVIHLNKKIDVYDDLMPICSELRTMTPLIHGLITNEILVIDCIYDRYDDKPEAKKLVDAMNIIRTGKRHNVTREDIPDLFLYQDVFFYSKHGKHIGADFFSEDGSYLKKIMRDYGLLGEAGSKEMNNLSNLQNNVEEMEKAITMDEIKAIFTPEYIQKIIELERELTDISLTQDEQALVDRFITHPRLNGLIESSGIHIFCETY